jgi:Zn finger protein HypA/HybF involved in hydrogenase expression
MSGHSGHDHSQGREKCSACGTHDLELHKTDRLSAGPPKCPACRANANAIHRSRRARVEDSTLRLANDAIRDKPTRKDLE